MTELQEHPTARLRRERAALAAEIRAYPAPIPACDAQYNHLLERRRALDSAIAALERRDAEAG